MKRLLKNKKGGILSTVFGVILILLIWAFWLGSFLQEWGQTAITNGDVTGFLAFLIANLNLFFLIFLVLGTYLSLKFGGTE